MKTRLYFFAALICVLFSCKKDNVQSSAVPTPVKIRMTDAPAVYNQVNVDIVGVQITGQGQTVSLNVNAGIYNLLDFANGADTLIATGNVTMAKVQQIRLILGPNNSVMADSVVYPLKVPSGSESGLKIQVHHDLQAGVAYEILLDFDAHQSVVETANGQYILKPVIRAVENAISGSITRTVSPKGVVTAITASGTSGGYSSAADTATGGFIIKGVPGGTYTVNVVPASPNTSVSILNVNVVNGAPASVGTVTI